MKIIFLDIDGVLATPNSIKEGRWALSSEKQELLKMILDATDAKIVLTSCWRMNTLEKTIEHMREEGFMFCDKLIGITVRAYHYVDRDIHMHIPRGVEIEQWIDTHIHSDNGKNWERKKLDTEYNYVILDDDSDMLLSQKDHFIRCHWEEGLTLEQVKEAIRILM